MIQKQRKILFASLAAYPLFNEDIDEPHGGAELDLFAIATRLDRRKFDVHFLVGDYGQEETENRKGVTVHRGQKILASGILQGLLNFFRLSRLIRTIDPDVIFTEAAGWLTVELIILKILLGKKIVFRSAHENNINGFTDSRPYGRPYRWLINRIDCFILQNDQDVRLLKTNFKYSKEAIVIRNLQDIPAEAPLSEDGRRHILWVGRSEKIKNPDLFVALSRRLPARTFVMIMPNTNDEIFEAIRSETEGLRNFSLIPGIRRDQIMTYFKEALYFISTSVKEGFPNTIVEAMKHGTPVISAYLDYDRILTEKACGVVLGDSADALASFIENTDDAAWRSLSANAHAFARDNFDIEKGINTYERIFLQV
jgi:glycosyltransferase involved in cell wall biosynthesis